ncbi:MAG: DUF2905 domain-containing protein [Anaerolinea sp.]|nr:DUF2905 domain-containing protein [Anaerolinea sp.]
MRTGPFTVDIESIGRVLLIGGLAVAGVGGLMLLLSRVPVINQLFNLPGDVRIQGENFSCFVPIVSMIIISVVLTVVVNLLLRIFNRQ